MLLLVITLSQVACTSSSPGNADGDGDKGDSGGAGGGGAGAGGALQMVAFSRDMGGGQLDLFAIAEDGSGDLVTLADDAIESEVFGGSTSDNRIIFARTIAADGGNNNIYSINDDGLGVPVALATDPEDELPVAVTPGNQVIFMRSMTTPGPHTDLLSIAATGGTEIPLADSDDAETLWGVLSDDRVLFHRFEPGLLKDISSILSDGFGGEDILANAAGIDETIAGVTIGNRVVFARTVGGAQNDILTISADGAGGESPLVTSPGASEFPVDVNDDDVVVFIRLTGSVMDLVSIDAAGGIENPLATSGDFFVTSEYMDYGGSVPDGRVIFHRCDSFFPVPPRECDVFSINATGGVEMILADDAAKHEQFVGVSSDERVIIIREDGGTLETDLISINSDGTGEIVLATVPTPTFPEEVFKGATANGRVIFARDIGGQIALFSIMADGSAPEVRLYTDAGDEFFGGIFQSN